MPHSSLGHLRFAIPRALTVVIALLVFVASPGIAPGADASQDKYADLLAKVKKSDPAVDFGELRLAYTHTPEYSPYGTDSDAKENMNKALDNGEYEDVLKYANMLLDQDYVDIEAHLACALAYSQLGDKEKQDYHVSIARGLLKSIATSGDGRSPETAYLVISVREEYIFMSLVLKVRPKVQSLVSSNGQAFDRFEVTDEETEEPSTIFFNVDIPFRWIEKILK